MNLLAVLAIFVFVQKAASSDNPFVLYINDRYAALALTKKRDSSQLQLAIPQKSHEWREYAYYPHDDTKDEKDREEEFMVACPARSNYGVERELEENWKKDKKELEFSTLYLLNNLDEYTRHSNRCYYEPASPSIQKTQKIDEKGEIVAQYCGESTAEIYEVGFPVLNRTETDHVQFVSIYKVCHSTEEGKGTLYSVHRIASPSLLLKKAWEFYKPNTKALYKCILDKSESSEQEKLLYEKQYAYQFVGTQDMPTKVWGSTTRFAFNYTPIPLNDDLMKGMIAVDNYIRLYSKETNTPLTLYSGVYQRTIDIPRISCAPGVCNKSVSINAFWRIVMNDEGLATIIVTQHTKMKCIEEGFICHNDRVMVKSYKKGGCTYTCSVNADVIMGLRLPLNGVMEQLDLHPLKIVGYLELTFPRKKSTDSSSSDEKKNTDQQLSEKVTIFDFFGKDDLETALMKADPDLVSTVTVKSQPPPDRRRHSYGYAPHYRPSEVDGKTGGGFWSMFALGAAADSGWVGGGGGDYGGGGDTGVGGVD